MTTPGGLVPTSADASAFHLTGAAVGAAAARPSGHSPVTPPRRRSCPELPPAASLESMRLPTLRHGKPRALFERRQKGVDEAVDACDNSVRESD